jgi:hypothetical protein
MAHGLQAYEVAGIVDRLASLQARSRAFARNGSRAPPSGRCWRAALVAHRGGRGLFAKRRLPVGTAITRILTPFWTSKSVAKERARTLNLPSDSFIELRNKACSDLNFWSPANLPIWYYLNHAHHSIANAEMRLAAPCTQRDERHLVWYATRDILPNEEIRFTYVSVPEEWNHDGLGLGTPGHSDISDRNRVRGKRPRPPSGPLQEAD